MDTHDLIRAISADAGRPGLSMRNTWTLAGALSVVVGGLAFLAMAGLRPDFAEAAKTMRFPMKFVVTTAVTLTALSMLTVLARPEGKANQGVLWAGPILLLMLVGFEMLSVPSGEWEARLVGTNSLKCLTFIPLIGLGPLTMLLAALRHAAPTRPIFSGAIAGIVAGGLAASFYAAHCPDDSPFFVATWYTIAIVAMGLAGAWVGPRVTRW